MVIMGIDPGLETTGYGFIEVIDKAYSFLDTGVIKTSNTITLIRRLDIIYRETIKLIEEYNPEEIAIEELFFSKNTKTAIKVSQARGGLLLACYHRDKKIFEYTPLQVKQGIAGYGRANKDQVNRLVCYILGLSEKPKPDDASDALAIAVCHGNFAYSPWANNTHRT